MRAVSFSRLPGLVNLLKYRALPALVATLAVSASYAQYEVKEWANFEDGKLPEKMISIGDNWQQRMQVVAVDSVTTQPEAFRNAEVGKHVLRLEAAPDAAKSSSWQVGLAVGDVIDRSQIGPNGRALFQADFYVESNSRPPSFAVLAMGPPEAGVSHVDSATGSFYRLGFTLGTKLYYSQVVPGEAKAKVFEQDTNLVSKLPAPGWHRFALVLEGPEIIRCYVDGREAAFSPMKDATMQKIMVGLLLAENKDPYIAYMDNLSIQVSNDAPALPASPFDKGWSIPAGASKKAVGTAGASTAQPIANLTTALASDWLPPVDAWAKAQKDNKGLLLYFYAPGVDRVEKVNQILQSDAAAKAYMGKHSCARIDVNQLEGGSIAKKYGIFKVPTFLVISPDAKSYKMYSPGPSDTWAQIESQLAPL